MFYILCDKNCKIFFMLCFLLFFSFCIWTFNRARKNSALNVSTSSQISWIFKYRTLWFVQKMSQRCLLQFINFGLFLGCQKINKPNFFANFAWALLFCSKIMSKAVILDSKFNGYKLLVWPFSPPSQIAPVNVFSAQISLSSTEQITVQNEL